MCPARCPARPRQTRRVPPPVPLRGGTRHTPPAHSTPGHPTATRGTPPASGRRRAGPQPRTPPRPRPVPPLGFPPAARSGGTSTIGPSAALDAPTGHPGVSVAIPLRTSSIGNKREHPLSRARRVRRETEAVLSSLAGHAPPPLPVTVEAHRVGWNRLDPLDGLPSAMKAPLDALARWLRCDNRDPRLHLRLSQSTTRAVRMVRDGRGRLNREAASSLRITVRPWRPADGDDALRVVASPAGGKR